MRMCHELRNMINSVGTLEVKKEKKEKEKTIYTVYMKLIILIYYYIEALLILCVKIIINHYIFNHLA